jgi:hypothetical protein
MRNLILAISVIALIGCGGDETDTKKKSRSRTKNKAEATKENEDSGFDKETLFGIIRSIPSPLETSDLIFQLKEPFAPRMLSNVDNVSNYTTTDKQALNLGIYGADLGYANIYGEKSESFNYLKVVRSLANDLKIGQFFSMATILRMQANANNMDSLIYISQRGFDQMNGYLEKQGRTDVSAQLLLGGWIESVYIATQTYKSTEDEGLKESIAGQKISIDELQVLIDAYRNKRKFAVLIKGFDNLKRIYDSVVIEVIEGEESMQIINGIPTMASTTTSIAKITPEQIEEITKGIVELRANIIK